METYFLSSEALTEELQEIETLLQFAEKNIASSQDNETGIHFGIDKKTGEYFTSFAQMFGLTIKWKQHYVDSLVDSYLQIYLADGDYYDRSPDRKGKIIKHEDYVFY